MDREPRWKGSVLATAALLVLALASCGGDGSDTPIDAPAGEGQTDSGVATGAKVVNPQPPGQGFASVDGVEYTFNTPGGIACAVSNEEFGFSFIIGDNDVSMGGGAYLTEGDWWGSLTLRVFADNQSTEYEALLLDNPSAIAADGNSVSYSGPFEKWAPNPAGGPKEPEDVGNGVLSATCG